MCNFACKDRPRNDLSPYTVSGGILNPTHSLTICHPIDSVICLDQVNSLHLRMAMLMMLVGLRSSMAIFNAWTIGLCMPHKLWQQSDRYVVTVLLHTASNINIVSLWISYGCHWQLISIQMGMFVQAKFLVILTCMKPDVIWNLVCNKNTIE